LKSRRLQENMCNRMIVLFTALVLLCPALFLASCAKKQIKADEATIRGPEGEMKEGEEKTDYHEEYRQREAERLAKLQEEERWKSEIQRFQDERIYFDFDKSELKPEAQAILKKKADWMRANPHFSLSIEGHCDERGTSEYNLALGERRAEAARRFLMALGISEDRLSTISYGEESPADPGHNEEAWAGNRRDEFKVMD
jgi:peptidoglycan-associated lipoprotein